MSHIPPDDIAASPSEILEAQAFFLQGSVAIMECLLRFSLAGGFARHFASPPAAYKFLASAVVHLLTSESFPPGYLQPVFPTVPILLASWDRPPFPRSSEYHCALTRHLLGPTLSTHLGVPPATVKAELSLLVSRIKEQILTLFSCISRGRAWGRKRAALTREALARVVRSQLGMRRTTFRARTKGGEVGTHVLSAEAVKPDPEGGIRLVREYRALIMKMAGMIAGVPVLVIGDVVGCHGRYAVRI